MPKLKSIKSAVKRFKATKSGRFKHRQGFRNHILTKKSTKRKRQLRSMDLVHPSDQKAVERMIIG
jgi:large subunit ribosomal protein L35